VNVLVDTSVWSLALRRKARRDHAMVDELAELIREGRVMMMGPIRQELLSGIKEELLTHQWVTRGLETADRALRV